MKKIVTLHIAPGSVDTVMECPDCGHQSLASLPLLLLGDGGVSEIGRYRRCVECQWFDGNDDD